MAAFNLKFASNISTMFKENYVIDRLLESRRMGFSAFEAQNLYDVNIKDLLTAKKVSGVDMVLTNSPPEVTVSKDSSGSYFGYACVPGKEEEFLESLQIAIEFAKSMDCKKIHILAGLAEGKSGKLLKKTYMNNLKVASEILQKENILGVIEPICPEVKPNYYLNSFDVDSGCQIKPNQTFNLAVELLEEISSPNLKLLLDVYHLQMLHGDAVSLLDRYYPHAGHIQVSQAPNREEPSARGLIDYRIIFKKLFDKGHSDFIGLEYTPKGTTKESLEFLKPSGVFHIDFQHFK